MKNNLFQWATSELSQDAFICWLMSYAMEGAKQDGEIKACAQDFVRKFLQSEDEITETTAIVVNNIERQVSIKDEEQKKRKKRSIDVLLTVNEKYKIIVEDKTYTSEHDNQLQVYKDAITALYPNYKVVGVYYKTGFQGDYKNVDGADYTKIGLAEIVELLGKCKTSNVIFNDYCEYLTDLRTKAEQFKTLPIQNWDWQQVLGYFSFLQTQLPFAIDGEKETKTCDFNTDFGCFIGELYAMWMSKKCNYIYNEDDEQVKYEIYLMLQFVNKKMDICLKLGIHEITEKGNLTPSSIRDRLVYAEKWKYKLGEYGYKKPARFGYGQNITLGTFIPKSTSGLDYENYGQLETDLKEAMQGFDAMIKAICIDKKDDNK